MGCSLSILRRNNPVDELLLESLQIVHSPDIREPMSEAAAEMIPIAEAPTDNLGLETSEGANSLNEVIKVDRDLDNTLLAETQVSPQDEPIIGASTTGDGTSAGKKAPAGDRFFTVLSANPELDSAPVEDTKDYTRLRERCPRFRILIIGKANAGKTTILQKMCNTMEKPLIHDEYGDLIDQSVIRPTDGRGIHDINNELTFSSNPDFVFHDSPGFEAGSITELESVRNFITERATSLELGDQLHAIWYCLPLDNDRPICKAEMSFFEQGTGRTPVIAIFTKYDGMILKEYNRLRFEENCGKEDARQKAPECADRIFKESEFYLKRLQEVPYPPARSVRIQDMQKPETSCAELSKQTLQSLDSKTLQLLFISVQQNNIGLSTEFAIKEYSLKAVKDAMSGSTNETTLTELIENIIICYGHLLFDHDYSDPPGRYHHRRYYDPSYLLWPLKQALPSLVSPQHSPLFQILMVGTVILILAEDSFWLKKEQHNGYSLLKLALEMYQSSNRHLAVIQELLERFGENLQDLLTHEEEEMVEMVAEVVRKFSVQA